MPWRININIHVVCLNLGCWCRNIFYCYPLIVLSINFHRHSFWHFILVALIAVWLICLASNDCISLIQRTSKINIAIFQRNNCFGIDYEPYFSEVFTCLYADCFDAVNTPYILVRIIAYNGCFNIFFDNFFGFISQLLKLNCASAVEKAANANNDKNNNFFILIWLKKSTTQR